MIEMMRNERLRLMERVGDRESAEKLDEITKKIGEAVEIDALHWKQRSRTNWLVNGDHNTGVFHAQATKRKKMNEIKMIVDDSGQVREEEGEIASIFKDFFEDLFKTLRPTAGNIADVVDAIQERVGEEDFELLDKDFDANEIKRAVFEMHPTKAPGPDGFNARFFQKFWPAVEEEVTNEVLGILNKGDSVDKWNETLICLILKVENPKRVTEFQPLSLYNTVYKIVSKVIANRLRRVLGNVIDPA